VAAPHRRDARPPAAGRTRRALMHTRRPGHHPGARRAAVHRHHDIVATRRRIRPGTAGHRADRSRRAPPPGAAHGDRRRPQRLARRGQHPLSDRPAVTQRPKRLLPRRVGGGGRRPRPHREPSLRRTEPGQHQPQIQRAVGMSDGISSARRLLADRDGLSVTPVADATNAQGHVGRRCRAGYCCSSHGCHSGHELGGDRGNIGPDGLRRRLQPTVVEHSPEQQTRLLRDQQRRQVHRRATGAFVESTEIPHHAGPVTAPRSSRPTDAHPAASPLPTPAVTGGLRRTRPGRRRAQGREKGAVRMNAAGWTISIIAILIVAAIALNVSRKSRGR
jgi:hypothetical protein